MLDARFKHVRDLKTTRKLRLRDESTGEFSP